MLIVQVAIPIPLMKVFDYQLPNNFPLKIKGCRVLVPFAKRTTLGIVFSHNQNTKLTSSKIKPIKQVLDKESLFSESLWSLLIWASQYYHYPIGEVLFHTLPILLRQGKAARFSPIWQWQITQKGKIITINHLNRAPKQQQALLLLQKQPVYHHQLLNYELNKNTLQVLKKKVDSTTTY